MILKSVKKPLQFPVNPLHSMRPVILVCRVYLVYLVYSVYWAIFVHCVGIVHSSKIKDHR
jgi:hypothetical protein